MGLVSLLKEQKKCKVVLILNDKELLEEKAADDYEKYREKVVDIELAFSPNAQECADIALSNDKISNKLKSFIEKLGINNIRIIKKIERLSKIIATLLTEFEEEVLNQALHSLTLFAWCFYGPKKFVPDKEFVKNVRNVLLPTGIKEEEETEDQKRWKAILRQYGYGDTSEFDLEVASAVEQGYINECSFLEEARKLNQQIIAHKSYKSFEEAWGAYHNSFDDDAREVVDAIYKSFQSSIKYIGPMQLEGTVTLFRELGKDDLADEIIELYIDKRKNDNKEIFDLSRFSFRSHIKDKKIIEKFAKVHESHREKRTLKEVLGKIAGKNGWDHDDEEILASASPDEYYALFKGEKGPHLSSFVDTCLQFGRFGNTSEQQRKISENATIALKRIGKEGPLNAMRVRKFGITPDIT